MDPSKKVNAGLLECGGSTVISHICVSICPYVKVREPLIGFPWKFILKSVVDFQFGCIPEDLRALGCLSDTHVAEYHPEREMFILWCGRWYMVKIVIPYFCSILLSETIVWFVRFSPRCSV